MFKKRVSFSAKEFGIFLVLILLIAAFGILSPYFFQLDNMLNILRQISLTGIMAIGMTMVIVVGEIDLSIASLYTLSAIVSGLCMKAGVPIWISCLIGVLSGAIFGIINGVLVTYLRLPALIATLGTLNLAKGTAMLITNGVPVEIAQRNVPVPGLDKFFFIGQGKLFGLIPVMAIFLLIISIIGFIIFNKTMLGFHMRAVGGSMGAAIASGIRVKRVKILAFTIMGILSSISGVINLAFITNVRADGGAGLELTVISAVILGGTSMSGGEGTLGGTIIGVLIMGVLRNGLVLLGVSPFWQVFMIGIVIIGAATMDVWLRQKRD